MRLLVAATALHPDLTSEGIATNRFVRALEGAGFDLRVLTRDRPPPGWTAPTAELASAPGVNSWARGDRALRALSQVSARLGRLARWAVDRVAWTLTGWKVEHWNRVAAWERGLAREIRSFRPDVLILRGAGGQLEPHCAVLRMSPRDLRGRPWVGHYHDPFPRSLYPGAYRLEGGRPARLQEHKHQQILDAATLLSFPSGRLRDYVLTGPNVRHVGKSVVLPHLAVDRPPPPPSSAGGILVLTHTGTLLRPRAVRPLVDGLRTFLERRPEARGKIRFVQVGHVHATHRALPSWGELEASGHLQCRAERVRHEEALALAREADVLVVVEAEGASSPFFPMKLADCLGLSKPILALSPSESVAADLLGASYPLRVDPSDSEGVVAALGRLWDAWTAGTLAALLPPPAAREALTPQAMVASLRGALAAAGIGGGGGRG